MELVSLRHVVVYDLVEPLFAVRSCWESIGFGASAVFGLLGQVLVAQA